MMNETAISWTKYTNNPIRFRRREDGKVGWHCEKVSQGCANCYAETLNMKWGTKDRFDVATTGKMEAFFDDKMMGELYKIKDASAKIFAFDMTDLFGAFIPDYLRAAAWCVMLDLPQHTFQLLTKRPESAVLWSERFFLALATPEFKALAASVKHLKVKAALSRYWFTADVWASHIWMGTSVEDLKATKRIDSLRLVPAATRFLSCEPLIESLGDVNLSGIHWVICGGESGKHLTDPSHPRWMKQAWARELRDACVKQDVAFFYKQDSGKVTEQRPYLVEADGTFWRWWQYPGDLSKAVQVDARGEPMPIPTVANFAQVETLPVQPEIKDLPYWSGSGHGAAPNPHYYCARCNRDLWGKLDRLHNPSAAPEMIIQLDNTVLCWKCFAADDMSDKTSTFPIKPTSDMWWIDEDGNVFLDNAPTFDHFAVARGPFDSEDEARKILKATDKPASKIFNPADYAPTTILMLPAPIAEITISDAELRGLSASHLGIPIAARLLEALSDKGLLRIGETIPPCGKPTSAGLAILERQKQLERQRREQAQETPPVVILDTHEDEAEFDTGMLYDQPSLEGRHPILCADCGHDFGTPEERRLNTQAETIIVDNAATPQEANLCSVCFRKRHAIPDDQVSTRETKKAADKSKSTPPLAVQDVEPKPTRVVDFRDVKDHWNQETQQWDSPDFVYIGRRNAFYNLPESIWHNPFTAGGDLSPVELFRKQIMNSPHLLSLIEQLRGKILVCWCKSEKKPNTPCHGDVLLELLGETHVEHEAPKVEDVEPKPEAVQLSLF